MKLEDLLNEKKVEGSTEAYIKMYCLNKISLDDALKFSGLSRDDFLALVANTTARGKDMAVTRTQMLADAEQILQDFAEDYRRMAE